MAQVDEFSICDECLGSDLNLKMMKHVNGLECKICTRPFTVYRWNTKESNKTKKTTICLTCARSRMCCQCCMLDINFHIPLDIRDTALKMAGLEGTLQGPTKTKNRELKALAAIKQEEAFKKQDEEGNDAKQNRARELLAKLSQRLNSGQIDIPKPIKEERVSQNEVSTVINKLPFALPLEGTDSNETSFFIFGFTDAPQYLISQWFEQFGTVESTTIVHRAQCGFVTFSKAESVEKCIKAVNENGLNENKKTAGLILLDKKFPMRIVRSKPLRLQTKEDGYKKLSLVVNKVMKQLAERDKGVKKKQITGDTNNGRIAKPKVTSTKYKSVGLGFEL